MATDLSIIRFFLLAVTFGASSAFHGRKGLQTKEMTQNRIIQLDHRVQPNSIDPSQVVQLSWQPRVFLYRGFLSEEECDYLIYWGRRTMGGNDLPIVNMNDTRNDPGISVDAVDKIARRVEERISAWTFLPKENSKSLSVLHIGPETSKQHHHYFDTKSVEQVGQPLLATVILYLSNVSQGGQLLFPQSKNNVWSDCTKNSDTSRPTRGNAIVFFNLHLNATPDRSSDHARCPIPKGDLWFATRFFYLKSISTRMNLTQSDYADCSDEDENCPGWAAMGECLKNSVFMVGSPDYYGTCRKSCNAC
ncbi:procollagen-proline 4-dioxygenase [Salvia divinorum]|uniref:procollagen-proline 4-dioxygenase n=1 Tax=Salvia divinorum TaxID=28513 RepID=A0ABD1IA27_SALDI